MSEQNVLTLWSEELVNEDAVKTLRASCDDLAIPVDAKGTEQIKMLVDTFFSRDDGVGLAAPQIGILKKVIIFRNKGFEKREWSKEPDDYDVLINPRITQQRGDLVNALEGCLSCPDVQVEVARFPEIKVRAYDAKGNKISKRYTDYVARIVQHEIDHLEGKLILDHDGALYYPKAKQAFFDSLFHFEE
ncbi:MAG: peptide deformylase [Syntrophobacterales bacterium]|jgi:peptide deformylase|nr:peptide deformylase [Syntrophobacterales bacterium]